MGKWADVAFEAAFKALSTKRPEQDVVAEDEYTMKKKNGIMHMSFGYDRSKWSHVPPTLMGLQRS